MIKSKFKIEMFNYEEERERRTYRGFRSTGKVLKTGGGFLDIL